MRSSPQSRAHSLAAPKAPQGVLQHSRSSRMLRAGFWPLCFPAASCLAGCVLVPGPCWCHLCLGPSLTPEPGFHPHQAALVSAFLAGCISQPLPAFVPCCCRYHQLLPLCVCLFLSSFYGLTDTKTVETHKFRVSKGSCGLRHAKKCQW